LPQLGLEDDEQEEREGAEQTFAQEAEPREGIAEEPDESQREEEHRDEHDESLEDAGAARAADESQDQVDADEDDRQLDHHGERVMTPEELKQTVEHSAAPSIARAGSRSDG